jgi:hypothetical protein
LEAAGIPVTAGQRTGSQWLKTFESNAADTPFSAGKALEMQAAQKAAYDRAISDKLFARDQLTARNVPADINLPDPRVFAAGKQSLKDEYTRLSQANQLRSDPQLQKDLLAAQTKYEELALPDSKSKNVEAIRNSLVDTLLKNQGSMAGDIYQAKRSQLGTVGKGKIQQGDPYQGTAFMEMRSALDQAMQRGLPPAEAQAWALNNQRYANMKQITPAIARAGENLSPQAVAQTARTGRAAQFAAQAGDLDPLSKAASLVMKPLPNSGTAARSGWQHLFNIPMLAAAGGGAAAGSPLGPLGIAAGAAAPFAASRLALTRPGQAYLGNQLMPQNMRDIITQTLAQQAISQPSQIARNQAAQAAYEQKRKDDLRKMGLQ